MTLGDYHTNLARVLPRVVQPAMTTLEARGERNHVQILAALTGRYATLGGLFFVVPLMFEAEGILRLWLGTYPPETPFFVRMAMIWLTIQASSSGFDRAVYAHGGLAPYALRTTGLWLTALGVGSFLLFGLKLGAWVMPATILAAAVAQISLSVGYGGRLIGLGYRAWSREIVAKVLVVAVSGVIPAWFVHEWLDDGWPRYVAVLVTYATASLPVTWWFAVGTLEKDALRHFASSSLGRLRATFAR